MQLSYLCIKNVSPCAFVNSYLMSRSFNWKTSSPSEMPNQNPATIKPFSKKSKQNICMEDTNMHTHKVETLLNMCSLQSKNLRPKYLHEVSETSQKGDDTKYAVQQESKSWYGLRTTLSETVSWMNKWFEAWNSAVTLMLLLRLTYFFIISVSSSFHLYSAGRRPAGLWSLWARSSWSPKLRFNHSSCTEQTIKDPSLTLFAAFSQKIWTKPTVTEVCL